MAWIADIPNLVIPTFQASPERLAMLRAETIEELIYRLDADPVCPSPSGHDEYVPLWQEEWDGAQPCPYCGVARNVRRGRRE